MNRKVFALFVLALMTASLACALLTTPDGEPSSDVIATAVAQTLEAGGPIPGDDPTVPPPDDDEEVPPVELSAATVEVPMACPQPTVLTIVYIDAGHVWKIEGLNPPAQLTFGATASSVLISGDGQKIAFTTTSPTFEQELRVVNIDGSGEMILLSQADLNMLVPPEPGSTSNGLWDLQFRPCSQELYFNLTARFEGPGHFTYDYLHSIDANTGVVTMILPIGMGGEIYFSPDGARIAISQPESISIANIDGSGYREDAHTFPWVMTASEFLWSPPVRWAPDSSAVALSMPSEEPFIPTAYGDMWIIPASETPPTMLGTIDGGFYWTQYNDPSFAPDLSKVVYTVEDVGNPNFRDLYFANPDGSGIMAYDYAMIDFQSWSPDSMNIAYGFEDSSGSFLKIGAPGHPPLTIDAGDRFQDVRWMSADQLLYLRGFPDAQDLVLATLGAGPTTLASLTANFYTSFDFVPRP